MSTFICDCAEKFKTGNCKNNLNRTNHYGTEVKYKAIEKYVEEWFEKTKNHYKKKGKRLVFNYIDVFAGSGISYDTKNDNYIDGTIARVINVLKRKAINNADMQFNILANDYNNQFCNCLKCYCNNNNIDNVKNLNIKITNLDYKDFISSIDLKKYKENWQDEYNINLVFYDPYRIDFDWDVLRKIFSLSFTDILINHIFPNDTKRSVGQVKDIHKIENYEHTYGVDINELVKINNLPLVDDKDTRLRKLFHNKLREVSNKDFVGFAPVIKDKDSHLHIFDLVVASNTVKACVILKDEMYNLYKEWSLEDTEGSDQLSFNFDIDDNISREKKSEFNFRYDIKSLGRILIKEFGGKTFSKSEFYSMIEGHEYLPTNCKKALKDRGYYKIVNKMYIVNDFMPE